MITSFEDKNPYEGGAVVEEHAADGRKGRGYGLKDSKVWRSFDVLQRVLHRPTGEALRPTAEDKQRGGMIHFIKNLEQMKIPTPLSDNWRSPRIAGQRSPRELLYSQFGERGT